jgi:virginiamycin B lyase
MKFAAFLTGLGLALLPHAAHAGGSNYGIVPGSLAQVAGKVDEWPVPTPEFARDPAPAPDGSIYIAVMSGNRIARFDPATQAFQEWELPDRARPHGLLVDGDGIVWYTGNGNGTIGRLDPASGKITELAAPSGGDPHTIVMDGKGVLWFTVQGGQRIGRLDRASGRITEYRTSGNPYGIAIDQSGMVWFCRIGADKLGRLDPATGRIDEVDTGRGSKPRRMAVAPDGSLWVTAYGHGKLLKVDTQRLQVVKDYPLPAGDDGGPYAVTVDGTGRVWVNEIHTDTVALFDPATERFRVIPLPSKNVGIRKAIVDAQGRYWYMGSHNGRLGVIQ